MIYPDAKCRGCKYLQQTAVFDLCKANQSQYSIEGKVDFHTVGHMRTRGACGESARLFEEKK